jgi:hypothetical protein
MQKELTYLNAEGNTVFTSQFLKNRGTCCKTACLHCPYGFTLKKNGLTFKEVQENDFPLVEAIINESGKMDGPDWKTFWPENIRLILLKDQVCGLFLKNHIVIKHLYLKPHFTNQDLSREMVESYFF